MRNPVHIALIGHGWRAKGYHDASSIKGPGVSMRLAVKGIILFTRAAPVALHFIVGDADETHARDLLEQLRPATAARACPVTADYTALDTTQVDVWMDAIGHRATHRTGHAGNVKFFYPLLFPQLDRLIMLDTDVLVASDLSRLWALFAEFDREPERLFAFVPQWPKYDAIKDNQFNAGVALLHLERMRRVGWLQTSRAAIKAWDTARMKPPCCAHGDQSVFHMLRWRQPKTIGLLPRPWNVNKCHGYQGLKAAAAQRAVLDHALQQLGSRATGDDAAVPASPSPSGQQPDYVRLGIIHLGCCKLCTRAKIGRVWSELLDVIDAWPAGTNYTTTTAAGGQPTLLAGD